MANYVLLERVTVGASVASVVFNSIPQTGYTDLKIIASVRTDKSSGSVATVSCKINTTTTSVYSSKEMGGTGSATDFASYSNVAPTSLYVGRIDQATDTSNTFGVLELYIPNYASSTAKIISCDAAQENNATAAYIGSTSWGCSDTSPITTLTFTPNSGTNFVQYSTFSLYGLAATGTTPAVYPKATGGDIIQTDGTYWYHAFLTSGIFTPQSNLTCNYLVVAGGGGGGNAFSNGTDGAGGGGAGGLRSTVTATGGGGSLESALSLLASTNYTVTIGAGGAGGTTDNRGSNGSNSVFSTITSVGGGGGGGLTAGQQTGANGGSGGGGSCFVVSGGTGTANQGYAGGSGASNGTAGGGGAGGVGANGVTSSANGGNGGVGVQITALATPTSTGANSGYYAGGGGGAADASSGTAGIGGNGGGGTGYTPTFVAGSGIANTGGGGGGGGAPDAYAVGGAGGSGIVIVRYAV